MQMRLNDGGVSEAVGYIIIFGLVMTGIGLITLYGYPVLMQQESSANIKNMEQTMIVLQNDVKSLTYKLVPYKETSLRVSGGTLKLVNRSVMDQTFTIAYNGPDVVTGFIPGELRYLSTKDNVVITLENGAVIERQVGQTGSFMLAQPRWYVDNNAGSRTLMINLVELGSQMDQPFLSQTGVGTVRMRHYQTLYWNPPGVAGPGATAIFRYHRNTDGTNDYDYSQAWRNFLTDTNGLAMTEVISGDPDISEFHLDNINNVVVKKYDLIVEEI
ncbi:MAG: hypothetical protein LUQ41_02300 [Methanomicrobiales archaeon]|nr:hypothetical protein [Methanomicrobiales archaeon]